MDLLERNLPFRYLNITPFLVLKDLCKTTIQLIPLHIELNKVLRLKALLKELELQIGTLPMN